MTPQPPPQWRILKNQRVYQPPLSGRQHPSKHVFVEANILPENWSAQTADVVTLTVPSTHMLGSERDANVVSVMPTAPSASLDLENSLEQMQKSLSMATDPLQLVEEHWLSNPTICTLLQNALPNHYVSLLQANMTANAGKTPQVARAISLHFYTCCF